MMKLFSLFIVALIFSTNSFAQGVLEIKNPNIELKNLKADDQPFTQIFKIKNTGDQPVIITKVSPFNASIKAEWTHEPIAPKKSGEIKLIFTPEKLPEKFNIRTLIYSNAKNKRTEINLSGNIVDNPAKPTLLYKNDLSGLKFKTLSVNFGKINTWQILSDTLEFINSLSTPVNLGIQYQPTHLSTVFQPAEVEAGQKGIIIITYDAPKKNDYGYTYESLILSINDSRDYKNRLVVTANLTEDFGKLSKKELANSPVASFNKKEISFGEIKKGEKTNCDFVLTNTGKSTLFVRKTRASCGCTAVTLGENAIAPGKSTTIRATFDSTGKSGRQYKAITVITNDPANPETVLTINGDIK